MPENLTDAEEIRLLDLSVVGTDKVGLLRINGNENQAGTEVTGGGYARAAAAFGGASASGGTTTKTTTAAHLFLNMPATEVQGWAIYASDGGRKWYGLFKDQQVAASTSNNNFAKVAHGLTNDQKVVFQAGFVPAGLVAATTYYVVNATADTFQVADTLGGTPVYLSTDMPNAVVGKVMTANAGEVFAIQAGSMQLSLA